jgi:hypothetical protein
MDIETLDARSILDHLVRSEPTQLARLPKDFGLYALRDHAGEIRYIGCTPKATEGFRTRIFSKHATGSEGRSHKFTQAYCTGRMWRYCKKLHPQQALAEQCAEDADSAKKLRNLFIRTFCSASYFTVPRMPTGGNYFSLLTRLEAEVQAMAPSSMREWEGIGFGAVSEPCEVVDRLLVTMPHLQQSIERQRAIWRCHVEPKVRLGRFEVASA